MNWRDNLNIFVQNPRVIVTAVNFAIANVFETIQKEFPVEKSHKATVTLFFFLVLLVSVEYPVFLSVDEQDQPVSPT